MSITTTLLNDVVSIQSPQGNILLSDFNQPDNKFWATEPYFDNFGVSFIASVIRDADCGADVCAYNVFSLPEYYIAYQKNGELIAYAVSVLGYALVTVTHVPTVLPTMNLKISQTPTSQTNSSNSTTLRIQASSSATMVPPEAALVGWCVMGFCVIVLCVGFCTLVVKKGRAWVLEEDPENLNQEFEA